MPCKGLRSTSPVTDPRMDTHTDNGKRSTRVYCPNRVCWSAAGRTGTFRQTPLELHLLLWVGLFAATRAQSLNLHPSNRHIKIESSLLQSQLSISPLWDWLFSVHINLPSIDHHSSGAILFCPSFPVINCFPLSHWFAFFLNRKLNLDHLFLPILVDLRKTNLLYSVHSSHNFFVCSFDRIQRRTASHCLQAPQLVALRSSLHSPMKWHSGMGRLAADYGNNFIHRGNEEISVPLEPLWSLKSV